MFIDLSSANFATNFQRSPPLRPNLCYTSPLPVIYEVFPFCEGAQLIMKKMKAGEELSIQGWAMAEGATTYDSEIKITGWIALIENDSDGFTFNADKKGENKDIQVIQKQFAEVKAQLIECFAVKKITTDNSKRFSFSSGNIVVSLLLIKRFTEDYRVSLYIVKPKK